MVASILAEKLADINFNLILISKDIIKLKKLQSKLLKKFFIKVDIFAVDLENINSSNILSDYLKKTVSNINSIIFLARNTNHLFDDRKDFSRELFNSEFNLSLAFPVEFSLKISQLFKKKLKSIIFTSSIYGLLTPNENLYIDSGFTPISYSSSRSAIIHAAKHLAKRLAPFTIVNTIVLGGVEGIQSDNFKMKYKQLSPSKQMIRKDDILYPFLYFINAPSTNFTGSVLTLDGGWTI